jgi:two-component system response regulator AtoC
MDEKERALVINSDPPTRIAIFNCLLNSGYEVSWVRDKDEAVKLMHAHQPRFLIVDVKDHDYTKEISMLPNSFDPPCPIVLLLEKENIETFKEVNGNPRISCIKKPIVPKDLINTLKNLSSPAIPEKGSDYDYITKNNKRSDDYWLVFNNSRNMEDVKLLVDQLAGTNITVLIRGENGVGKDLVAKALYTRSNKNSGPFIKVNCAALPKDLMESELFGHEKGAFTGAIQSKPGKFDLAADGTIFLDEISEIDYSLQAKLLQVLQDGEFSRLGGEQNIRTNARVIASTKADLEKWTREGVFRKDLYYRLNAVCIPVPPLRERKEDIPLLAEYFVDLFARQYKKTVPSLSEETTKRMLGYHWPGNVRELQNAIKNFVLFGDEKTITEAVGKQGEEQIQVPSFDHTEKDGTDPFEAILEGKSLREVTKKAVEEAEKQVILKVLSKTRWNRKKACEILELSYKSMLFKIREYGLDRYRQEN